MSLLRRPEPVVALVLLAAMVLIGAVNPAFWSLDNLFGLLKSNVIIGIMALGVLLVMISGGIDVSFPAFAVAAMYLVVRAMVDTGYSGVALPFVGTISMDSVGLDVSALPEGRLAPGSTVELLCAQQSVDDVAAQAGTIGYEVLTRLGSRFERRYLGA